MVGVINTGVCCCSLVCSPRVGARVCVFRGRRNKRYARDAGSRACTVASRVDSDHANIVACSWSNTRADEFSLEKLSPVSKAHYVNSKIVTHKLSRQFAFKGNSNFSRVFNVLFCFVYY